MNKVYKVIWNHATQTWVAVSEIAQAKGKTSSKTDKRAKLSKAAAVVSLAVAGSALIGGQAQAAVVDYTLQPGKIENRWDYKPVALGVGSEALGNSSVAIGNSAKTRKLSELADSRAASENRLIVTDWRSLALKNDQGQPIDSDQTTSSVFGGRAATYGQQATAIGESAEAVIFSTATGQNAKAMGFASVATGQDSQALDRWSVAVGVRANARGEYSSSLGGLANATKWGSTALGTYTVANGDEGTAVGYHADVTGRDGTASGAQSLAAEKATATGAQAKAEGNRATASGFQANASGANAVAAGVNSSASGESAVAVGRNTTATKAGATAVGNEADATGDFATAVGHESNASGNNALALGRGTIADQANSVALGSNSKTAPAIKTESTTLGSFTYDFDGNNVASTVSVGNDDVKRTITNVAAGRVNETSTDAINGSQLYAVASTLGYEIENIYFHANTNTSQGAGDSVTNKGKITDKAGATGAFSVTGGVNAKAVNDKTVAMGYNAHAGLQVVKDGELLTQGHTAVAIGNDSRADSTGSIAIGNNAKAEGIFEPAHRPASHSIAIGDNAAARGMESVSIGGFSQAGIETNVDAAYSVAVGHNAKVLSANGVAVGHGANVSNAHSVAIGKNANTTGSEAVALGVETKALSAHDTALGRLAVASGGSSTVVGNRANGTALGSQAFGTLSNAVARSALAVGHAARSEGLYATAVGRRANATAESAIAIGENVLTTGQNAIAIGASSKTKDKENRDLTINDRTQATGTNAIAIGYLSKATATNSIAIGTGHVVEAENAGAFGDPSYLNADADGSYAIGNNNTITTENTFVLGSGINRIGTGANGAGTVANSVYLGYESEVTGGRGSVDQYGRGTLETLDKDQGREWGNVGDLSQTTAGATGRVNTAKINGVTYGSYVMYGPTEFAGAEAKGAVTVGAGGMERRIQNVAAGEISKTSTDAINGSQLYAVADQASKPIRFTANSNKDTANTTMSYIGENGLERILGDTINIQGATTSKGLSRNTDAATDSTYSARNVQTVVDNQGIQIQIATNPIFDSVQFGSNTGPKITNDGSNIKVGKADGSATRITNVANGTEPNDAVNLSQLNATRVSVVAGNNTYVTEKPSADGKTYKIDAEKTVVTTGTGLTVSTSGGDSANNVTTYNVALDKATQDQIAKEETVSTGTPDLVTVTTNATKNATGGNDFVVNVTKGTFNNPTSTGELAEGNTGVATVKDVVDAVNKGFLTTKVNGTQVEQVGFGDDINFVDGKGTTARISGQDITYDVNLVSSDNSISITDGTNGAKDLTVNTGTSTVGGDGKAITTDADEVANLGDVVNTINNVSWSVNSVAAGGENTYKVTDTSKISAGDKLNINAGKNIAISGEGDTLNIATSDNVTFNNVTTNNFTVNQGGTVNMGGNTVTNVANGTNATDAVNLQQLNATKVAVLAGDNTAVTSAPNATTGGTDYTVHADKTVVSPATGSNITVTPTTTTNANGTETTTYSLDLDQATKDQIAKEETVSTGTPALVTVTTNATKNSTGGNDFVVNVTKGTFNGATTEGALNTAGTTDGVATVGDVIAAVNAIGFNVTSGGNKAAGDDASSTLINPGEEITYSAGKNLTVKRVGNEFTYATADDVTFNNITTNNFTVNPGGTVNMGGNTITNVANGTNPNDAVNLSQLNASTAANAWKITGNNDDAAATTVGNQTVSFNNGAATTAVVDGTNVTYNVNADGKTTQITYTTATGATVYQVTDPVTGVVTYNTQQDGKGQTVDAQYVTGSQITAIVPTFNSTVFNSTVNSTTGAPEINIITGGTEATTSGTAKVSSGSNATDVATIGDLVETINNIGFNVTSGGNKAAGDDASSTLINPGEEITYSAGKNLTVKREGNNFTYATADDVTFNNVTTSNLTATGNTTVSNFTVTPNSVVNMGGNTITNVAPGTNGTDAVNLNQLNATKVTVLEGKNTNVTSAVNQTTGGTDYTINAVDTSASASVDDASSKYLTVAANGTTEVGNATVTDYKVGLSAEAINKLDNAIIAVEDTATVNMTVTDGTLKADVITNNGAGTTVNTTAGGVSFDIKTDGTTVKVGDNNALTVVTGGTEAATNGTAKVSSGSNATDVATIGDLVETINNIGFNVTSGGNKAAGDDASSTLINPGEEITYSAGKNLTVKRVGNEFTYATADDVTFNNITTNNFTVNPGGTVNMGGNTITNVANGTNPNDAVNLSQLNASTAANAWKITGNNDDAAATTVGNQTVSFNNGAATTAVVDGTNVTYNVNADGKTTQITYTTATGATVYQVTDPVTGVVTYNTQQDGKGQTVDAQYVTGSQITAIVPTFNSTVFNSTVNSTTGAPEINIITGGTEAATNGTAKVSSGSNATDVATIGDLVDTINSVGWFTNSTNAGGNTTGTAADTKITAGKAVNFEAGTNLKVEQKVVDGNVTYTYSTADDVTFNNITASNLTVGPVTITNDGIDAGNTTITNVAPGTNGTDAVNLDQLNASTAANAWKITGNNDAATATTVGNQTVSFNNGTGTTAVVDGTNVTYNINTDGTTVKVGTDGNLTVVTGGLTNNNNGTVSVPTGETGSSLVNQTTVANAINNSGWQTTLTNGTVETINPGDKVNYVNGTTTIANVAKDGSGTVNVSYEVNTTAISQPIKANTDGKAELIPVDGKTDANKLVTAVDVINTINQSGWKLAADGTAGTELINPSETVTFKAGTNLEVVRDGANITYKTADNVSFNNITTNNFTVNPGGTVNMGGNTVTNVATGTNGTDAVNLDQLNSSVAAAKTEVTSKDKTVTVNTTTGTEGQTIYDLSVKTDGTTIKSNATTGALEVVTGNTTVNSNGTIGIASGSNATDIATIGDITKTINQGYWTTKVNGTEVDQVSFGDAVNYVNGNGTVARANGTNITFDVKTDGSTIIVDGNGSLAVNTSNLPKTVLANGTNTVVTGAGSAADPYKVNVAGDLTNITSISNGNTTIALGDKVVNVGGSTITGVANGTKPTDAVNVQQLNAAKTEVKAGNNVNVTSETGSAGQTIYTVNAEKSTVTAADGSPITVNSTTNATTGVTNYELDVAVDGDTITIKDGKLVSVAGEANKVRETVVAGSTNVVVKDDKTNATGGKEFTVDLAKDITVNSVTANTVNVGPVTMTGGTAEDGVNELSVGTETSPSRITNVAPGVKGTDAVNVNQLQGAVTNINNRINDLEDDLDAGMAGARAIAALPQVHRPGSSMLAVGLGSYGDKGAVAVGFSSLSDNGRLTFKANVDANTENKFGAGVGMGWEW
ncbi:YadA-like family protein [Moraxella sp. FZFQ2102]|uniref:ESPR-type extended signal peptide-containing protein n=1 Tax=Moraxella sp. FZFQ2102 TaxID=2953752 RepID=UPI00209BE0F8|nr:ESPR-type extended signal peptide-containing protein [Moraxella sp. FZFQ2102]USZ14588.1 YadA-like family protein [Moraxella sp. FZFQ2102]